MIATHFVTVQFSLCFLNVHFLLLVSYLGCGHLVICPLLIIIILIIFLAVPHMVICPLILITLALPPMAISVHFF